MLHPIDPTVDYAFKRLLGDPAHADLLLDFLNAVLKPPQPVVEVEILNPFNEREFDSDKLTVVDVKALLADGHRIQVEVQSCNPPLLRERMLYGWADVYQDQLADGEAYTELMPVSAIWVLRDVLFREGRTFHHRFGLVDPDQGLRLTDHIAIHTLELARFDAGPGELDAEGRWVYFMKEARGWTELPSALETPTLRKAMGVLKRISDKKEDYWAYQARQNFLRAQATTEKLMREAVAARERLEADFRLMEAEKGQLEADFRLMEAEKGQIEAEKGQIEAEKGQIEAERERLVRALREAGLDPEQVLRGDGSDG